MSQLLRTPIHRSNYGEQPARSVIETLDDRGTNYDTLDEEIPLPLHNNNLHDGLLEAELGRVTVDAVIIEIVQWQIFDYSRDLWSRPRG